MVRGAFEAAGSREDGFAPSIGSSLLLSWHLLSGFRYDFAR
jgi:hypothetical protein